MEKWEVLELYRHVAEMGRRRLSHKDLITRIYGQKDMLRRLIGRLPMRLPSCMEEEDLMHEAVVSISHALRAYEPHRGDLGEYLKLAVRRGVWEWLRLLDPLSRRRSDQCRVLLEAHAALEQRLHRAPRDEELAVELGWSVDVVRRVIDAVSSRAILSWEDLPEQVREMADDCDPHEQAAARSCARRLGRAVGRLPPEERRVVELYYSLDLTMREMAARTNISVSEVARRHKRALVKLRAAMA